MAPLLGRTTHSGRPFRGLLRTFLASAMVLTGFTVATSANAWVIKKTSQGELVHWEERTVGYSLDPRLDANVPGATAATRHAMDAWSGSVGAPDLQPIADPARPERPAFDGKNGVFFIPGGYAPAGRALAITVLTYDNGSGFILDADIIFNGAYDFRVLEANADGQAPKASKELAKTDVVSHDSDGTAPDTPETVYDLHHVVAHELGHSLGMNDEMERRDALMYRYTSPNDATLRSPAHDDISGLAELYATRIEARGNGCGAATVAPKKPSRTAEHAALLAAAALVVFVVLRARTDRRARLAFVAAAGLGNFALLPHLGDASPAARAAEAAPGHARARVIAAKTAFSDGLMKTTYSVATTACRASRCPARATGSAWGGVIGHIRQDVGGAYAPQAGDDVDVSFTKLANALAPLSQPLGPGPAASDAEATVRVLTKAF